jgi:methyltransferase
VKPRRFAVVLAAFGIQRLLELAYSRRNLRRMRARGAAGREAAGPGFAWIAMVNVALFSVPLLERIVRKPSTTPGAVRAVGWMGEAVAVALRWWAITSLGEHWNVRAIVPDDLAVVERGPYRFVRHPNYLALGIEFAALPLIGGAYLSAIGLSLANALVLRRRIRDEERLLDLVPGYAERMGGRPRFLPRLRASTATSVR